MNLNWESHGGVADDQTKRQKSMILLAKTDSIQRDLPSTSPTGCLLLSQANIELHQQSDRSPKKNLLYYACCSGKIEYTILISLNPQKTSSQTLYRIDAFSSGVEPL